MEKSKIYIHTFSLDNGFSCEESVSTTDYNEQVFQMGFNTPTVFSYKEEVPKSLIDAAKSKIEGSLNLLQKNRDKIQNKIDTLKKCQLECEQLESLQEQEEREI